MAKGKSKGVFQGHQYEENINLLVGENIPYTGKGAVLNIKVDDIDVDLYPHSGRWKVNTKDQKVKYRTGGTRAFIRWYRDWRKNGKSDDNES